MLPEIEKAKQIELTNQQIKQFRDLIKKMTPEAKKWLDDAKLILLNSLSILFDLNRLQYQAITKLIDHEIPSPRSR